MLENVKKHINSCDVISFDVFDTLLFRKIPHPQDLFYLIEQKYGLEGFKKKRIKAEIVAREKSKTGEVNIEDIYTYLPGFDKLVEIYEEEKVLFANPDMITIYKLAKASEKKIICISDMYLPKDIVYSFLSKQGFDAIDEIFVSCDYQKTKADGSLYDIVSQSLQVNKREKILHIGDNFHSDVKRAKLKGLKALHYHKENNMVQSCLYKNILMQNSIFSLYDAQMIKLGIKDLESFSAPIKEKSIRCNIRWIFFRVNVIAEKCRIYGLHRCFKKVIQKFVK